MSYASRSHRGRFRRVTVGWLCYFMSSKVSIIIQMYYHILAILVTFCHILHFILFVSGTSQMCLYNTITKSSGTCRFCCHRFAFYGFWGTIVSTENFFYTCRYFCRWFYVPLYITGVLNTQRFCVFVLNHGEFGEQNGIYNTREV